jgi:hypothetical protein
VDDPRSVDGRQCRQRGDREPVQPTARPWARGPDESLQGDPGDELTHDVRLLPVRPDVEHGRRTERRHSACRFDLAQEVSPDTLIAAQMTMQQFDGNLAPSVTDAPVDHPLSA